MNNKVVNFEEKLVNRYIGVLLDSMLKEQQIVLYTNESNEIVDEKGILVYFSELVDKALNFYKGTNKYQTLKSFKEVILYRNACPACGSSLKFNTIKEYRGECWGFTSYEDVTIGKCTDCSYKSEVCGGIY